MEFVLQLLLVILLSWQHAIGHDCKDYLYLMRSFQLQGNVIETNQTTKYGCRQSCHSHKDCLSINYKEKEYRCELNAATHLSHPQMLRPEANAFYALIKTPNRCSKKHCSSEKRCTLVGNKVAYQCIEDCQEKALGMESGAIGDSAITASSINHDLNYVPRYARLNAPSSANNGWIAGPKAADEYLQVDLGRVVAVTKVATQGRRNAPMWMKTYNIGYSTDLSTWHVYREGGNAQSPHKVFTGNSDQHTVVYGSFEEPIHARGI
ncbi:lactadherin [Nematostella vectensis]|uniref:lactadherin n=1 Tax=Nematostella vectensis TaxID=45351 RepID=UPI002076E21A|nr:lactadherin [Nematostella vectensis]